MMKSQKFLKTPAPWILAAAVLSAGALIGCGDDGAGGATISHAKVERALDANARAAVDDLGQGIGYVRDNAGFGVSDFTQIQQGLDEECDGEPWCDEGESVALEESIAEQVDGLIELLKTQVLVQANIEAQSDTEITYLLKGDTMCEQDADDYADCVHNTDALQLRLVVTSPTENDLDFGVQVGPQRFRPLKVELHRGLIAGEVNLGELAKTIKFAGEVTGEPLDEMPETLQGRARLELQHAPTRFVLTASVLDQIKIGGNGWNISLEPSAPAARLTVDSSSAAIDALLDLNALAFAIPVKETIYSWSPEEGDSEEVKEYNLAGYLAGISAQFGYQLNQQVIEISNLGLGSTTSTLDVNDKRVLEVDLNADHGRKLNLSLKDGADGVELEVDPALDLKMVMKFGQVADVLNDVAHWAYDEVLRVRLDGAEKPRVQLNEGQIKVLAGQLHLSSSSQDIDLNASAGQCLLAPDEPSDEGGIIIDGEWGEYPEPEEEKHPFADLEGGACAA